MIARAENSFSKTFNRAQNRSGESTIVRTRTNVCRHRTGEATHKISVLSSMAVLFQFKSCKSKVDRRLALHRSAILRFLRAAAGALPTIQAHILYFTGNIRARLPSEWNLNFLSFFIFSSLFSSETFATRNGLEVHKNPLDPHLYILPHSLFLIPRLPQESLPQCQMTS
mgnify:CR=1 FL=1